MISILSNKVEISYIKCSYTEFRGLQIIIKFSITVNFFYFEWISEFIFNCLICNIIFVIKKNLNILPNIAGFFFSKKT